MVRSLIWINDAAGMHQMQQKDQYSQSPDLEKEPAADKKPAAVSAAAYPKHRMLQ